MADVRERLTTLVLSSGKALTVDVVYDDITLNVKSIEVDNGIGSGTVYLRKDADDDVYADARTGRLRETDISTRNWQGSLASERDTGLEIIVWPFSIGLRA